jgi:DNA-binding response OmpR family regulator
MTPEQQIDALTEQVAYWRSEAMGNADISEQDAIRQAFKIAPNQAWVAANLYRLRGRILARARIEDDMPLGHGHERLSGKVPEMMISRIRNALGFDVIETVRGHGYRMTNKGIALCDAALTGPVA